VVTVDGPFTARGQLLGCAGAEFQQIVDGTGELTGLGASTVHLDYCFGPPPMGGPHHPLLDGGTFAIGTPDGTLTGTMSGYVDPEGPPSPDARFPFHFELVITAGADRFAGATGTLVADGAFGPAAFQAWGTISGTVTIPPGQPQSVADCKHGGWRDHVDDEGRPFRSQGHCIRWVRHHQP
jgi:hypothetical protein